MNRLLLCLFAFILCYTPFYAQFVDFDRIPSLNDAHIHANIPGMNYSDIATGDIDQDGDVDLVFTGRAHNFSDPTVYIYLNDGQGAFIEQNSNCIFAGYKSSCFLEDFDADGDLDLFFTGLDLTGPSPSTVADLYYNNGQGKFRLDTAFTLHSIFEAVAAVGDVNGDALPDIFISGKSDFYSQLYMNSYLLLNSAQGNFAVDSNLSITPVYNGDALFTDIDNDSDLDLITTGVTNTNGSYNASLYKNNGFGTFTNANAQLIGVKESSVSAGDINGDGLKELLITGERTFPYGESFLYNNQNGNFVLNTTEDLVESKRGIGAFLDYNGDGYLDIYLSENTNSDKLASLYTNNGQGNFTLDGLQNVKGTTYSAVAAFDADQDGDMDLALSGRYEPGFNMARISLLYENDMGIFKKADGVHFNGTNDGDADLADVDNDGDLDLLTTGNGMPGAGFNEQTRLFLNNGQGHLIEKTNHALAGSDEKFTFAYLNGDSLIDLLLCGSSGAEVYFNSTISGLTFSSNLLPNGARKGDVTCGDLDGDGDTDLVISRKENHSGSANPPLTTVFFNNGNGTFSEQVGGSIHGVESTSLDLFDADNDGDLDLFQLGYDYYVNYAELFLNDGNGNFSLSTNLFRGVRYGASAHGDIDADGDIDLIYMGDTTGASNGGKTCVYLNQGNGTYSYEPNTGLADIERGDVTLGDIDQDGDLDLYLMGNAKSPHLTHQGLYLNDGSGNFTTIDHIELEYFSIHDAVFGDMNNDGNQDLIVHGYSKDNQDLYGLVYENKTCSTSTNITTVNACNGYEWPENLCTYTSSGTYYSTRKNPNGCNQIEQLVLTIDTSFSAITVLDTMLMGPSGYTTYQWLSCDSSGFQILQNEINQSFVPTITGVYALVVSTASCSDTSACVPFQNVHLREFMSTVRVFPNPSDRLVHIQNVPFSSKYSIINSVGLVVREGNLSSGNNALLIDDLSPGYYTLTLTAHKTGKFARYSIIKK